MFFWTAGPMLIALLAIMTGLAVAGASYYADVRATMAPPEEAIAARGGGARIYDRNGTLLYEFLDEKYGRQERVKLDLISPDIRNATIAAEDASFYSNPGINVKGLGRAALENLKPGEKFGQGTGGSSITQQLVKQIYFSADERGKRTYSRKLKEMALAIELTRRYDKDQILEWYLNEIPYGGTFTGIEAASEGYLGVPAAQVTLAQAALLAGLPQSPSDYDPFLHFDAALGRQHEVLDLMAKHGYISQDVANLAKFERIELHPKQWPFLAPHFVFYVGDYIKATLGEDALYHGGLNVWATLDLNLNNKVNGVLEENLQAYERSSNGHNGSVVAIDPSTGQILAMVGSRDYFRADVDGSVNNALALNSPGSTLKPFTYVTAFMQGWGPDWPVVDTTIDYKDGDKTFTPRNPDGRTRGVMPVKQALGNSFNIPAFKTILWAGVDNVVATAKAMGLTTLDRDLGPALTLGGVDVKLLDEVYGYSVFANAGAQAGVPAAGGLPDGNRALDPVPVLKITNRSGDVLMDNTQPRTSQVIKPEYAWMISDILSTDANRQITYGAGNSQLNVAGWHPAAKTGTSEPYENSKKIGDTWTVGYTPDIALGVWVGNSDNSPMDNILSTTIAGRTWHDSMVAALEGKQPRDFTKPPGLVTATVCVPSGLRATQASNCPTVTGTFAEDALAKQSDDWWGGQKLSGPLPLADRLARIPGDVTGYRRYLAEEYQRSYNAGRGRTDAPPQQPAPAPQTISPPPPAAPPQPTPQPRRRGNGNGNAR